MSGTLPRPGIPRHADQRNQSVYLSAEDVAETELHEVVLKPAFFDALIARDVR
jgi:hypothetical protein